MFDSVLAAAARGGSREVGSTGRGRSALEALVAKELKTDDPEAKEGELCAAFAVGLARAPLPAPSREGGGARRLRSHGRPAKAKKIDA